MAPRRQPAEMRLRPLLRAARLRPQLLAQDTTRSTTSRCRPLKSAMATTRRSPIADHAIECLKEHAAKARRPSRFSHTSRSPSRTFRCRRRPKTSPATKVDTTSAGTKSATTAGSASRKCCTCPATCPPSSRRSARPIAPRACPKSSAPSKSGPRRLGTTCPRRSKSFRPAKWKFTRRWSPAWTARSAACSTQLRAMNAVDNTLVLFLSDNGASAEIMVRGDGHDPNAPQGSAATFLCLGPGWSNAANTPFRRHKIVGPRRRHRHAADRPLARGNFTRRANCARRRPRDRSRADDPETRRAANGQRNRKDKDSRRHPGTTSRRHSSKTSRSTAIASGGSTKKIGPIRQGDWKLVAAHDEQWQLYNLAKDRAENDDLASKYPEKAKELVGPLAKASRRVPTARPKRCPEKPKPKNRSNKEEVHTCHPERALATEGSRRGTRFFAADQNDTVIGIGQKWLSPYKTACPKSLPKAPVRLLHRPTPVPTARSQSPPHPLPASFRSTPFAASTCSGSWAATSSPSPSWP